MKIIKHPTFAALAARAVMLRFSPQIILAGALALHALPARADTFGSGTNTFIIDFVDIGNPGNGDDLGAGGGSFSEPYGGVEYIYRIGVTEVPQDWITKATRLGLTHVTAGAWSGKQPAANMTWYEAAAFVNWLNTSTGHQPAYDLAHNGGWSMKLWTSDQAWQAGGENLYRHKDAFYFLPSFDEWYKAGWHKNDGVTANYWDYATGSNTIPAPVASGTGAGTAVYMQAEASSPAAVDNNGGMSPYGTRGQTGNVAETQETAFDGLNNSPSKNRNRGGGRWFSVLIGTRNELNPSEWSDGVGFRVASVPEPARLRALGAGVLRIQSSKGMVFEVQASTDLNKWPPLTAVTNLTGTLEFTDPDAANQLRRFYRTVLR
jgi:formylglycine-generating enzyme